MLSGCEFLNSILAMMNYQAVAAIFLELATVAKWLELPETEDRTTEKVVRMVVIAGIVVL
jgi:hypothetical protein